MLSVWSVAEMFNDLLPPSPPTEQTTARQDQTGQASTDDGESEPINTRCFEKESKFFKDGTRRRGKLLPAEAFLLIAENSLAMAARYQPELTNRETGEKQPNPNYNEERYAFFC
jgi:hypothetical protein